MGTGSVAVALVELSVTVETVVPAASADVAGVRVSVAGALAPVGVRVSHAELLVAVHGIAPVPAFCTATVAGDGEVPVGLNRYTFGGVAAMIAVGVDSTEKVTPMSTGLPVDGVRVTVPVYVPAVSPTALAPTVTVAGVEVPWAGVAVSHAAFVEAVHTTLTGDDVSATACDAAATPGVEVNVSDVGDAVRVVGDPARFDNTTLL